MERKKRRSDREMGEKKRYKIEINRESEIEIKTNKVREKDKKVRNVKICLTYCKKH